MKVFLTGATGYIGRAIATALQTTNHKRSWALTDDRQMMGALADALVLDRQVSSAKARQVLDWQPQAPSLFDELKGGAYALR
jgi:thioester reductase-like protein